jgi:WD40 repeat protein
MKPQKLLRFGLGPLIITITLLACTFTIEVLPTATPPGIASTSVESTFTPTFTPLPVDTFVAPSATPTLIAIQLGMTSMLENFMTLQGGETPRVVTFSPDGAFVAEAGGNTDDFGIRVWDVATGQPLAILGRHGAFIDGLAFSPDGQLLVSASHDGTAKIWDWRNGDQLKTLEFPNGVYSVSFSPDGQILAIGGVDEMENQINHAAIWTFAVGSWEPRLKFYEFWNVTSMAYSPNGGVLVGGGTSRNVQVWRASDAATIFTLNHAHQVADIAISPDGSKVATGTCITVVNYECTEGGIWLWDLPSGRLLRKISGFPSGVESVEFTADGSMLIATTRNGVLRFYSTADYAPVYETTPPNGNGVLALSSDSGLLATTSNSGEVRLWKVVYRP